MSSGTQSPSPTTADREDPATGTLDAPEVDTLAPATAPPAPPAPPHVPDDITIEPDVAVLTPTAPRDPGLSDGPARARALAVRIGDRLRRRPAQLVLAGVTTVWCLIFSNLLITRHNRFGSFDFDLGIWDQSIWLISRGGNGMNTVRGIPALAHHFVPMMYAYVPFYWLGAGPNLLNVSMVAAVGAGAVAVFQAAKHHLRNEWHALVPAVAFLVNYAAQWMLQETWHPEVMALPFLLFAYVAAVKGEWRNYAICLAIALMWKEDVALATMMLGVVLAIRGRRTVTGAEGPALTRKIGLVTMLVGAVYFVAVTQFVIPHFAVAGNFTEGFFGDLGATTPEIAKSVLTHPDLVRAHLAQSNPQSYVQELTGSFGFVGWFSPLALLIGLPQTAINLLTVQSFFWPTKVHYAAMPLFAVTIGSVEGLARFKRLPVRRALLGAMAAGAFFTAVSWGLSPISKDYRAGYWPLAPVSHQAAYDEALTRPGPDDAVSVQYNLTPHLTHRDRAYTFPNPWIARNWGVDGENRPDPAEVDWIILDPSGLDKPSRAILASALREPDKLLQLGAEGPVPPDEMLFQQAADPSKWTVVTEQADLFVAHRVR